MISNEYSSFFTLAPKLSDAELANEIQKKDPVKSPIALGTIDARNNERAKEKMLMNKPPTIAEREIAEAMPQVAGIGANGIPVDPNISLAVTDGVGALPNQMAPFDRDNTGILGAETPMTMMAAGGGLIELAGGGEVIPFQNRGLVPDFIDRYDPLSGYYDPRSMPSLEEQQAFLRAQELTNLGIGGSYPMGGFPEVSTGPLMDAKERVNPDITGFNYRKNRINNLKAQLAQPNISNTERARLEEQLDRVARPSPRLFDYNVIIPNEKPEDTKEPFLSAYNRTTPVVERNVRTNELANVLYGPNVERATNDQAGVFDRVKAQIAGIAGLPGRARDKVADEAATAAEGVASGIRKLDDYRLTAADKVATAAENVGSTAGAIGSGIEDSFVGKKAKGIYGGLKALTDSASKGTFTKDLKAFWNDPQSQEEMQKLPFIFGKKLSDDPMTREAQLSNRKEFLEAVGPTALTTAFLWPLQTAKTVAAVPTSLAKGLKSLFTTQGGKAALKTAAVGGSAAYTNKDKLSDIFDQEKAKLAREAEKNKNEISKDIPENEENQLNKNTKEGLNQANKALDSIEKEIKQEIKDVDKIDKKEKKSAMDTIKERFKTNINESEFNNFIIATGLTYAAGGSLPQAAAAQWPNYIKQKEQRAKLEAAERIASNKLKLDERKLDVTSKYYQDLIAAKASDSRVGEKDIMKALADNQDYISLDMMRRADEKIKQKSSFLSTYELTSKDIEDIEKDAVGSFLRRIGVGGLGTSPPERSEEEQAEIDFLKNIARPTG